VKKKSSRKMEPVFLGDEISEYLNTKKIKGAQNLLVCWQQIVSPAIEEHTDNVVYSPRSKNNKVLVYVDSPAFAVELTMDKELYRLKLQQVIKKEISYIKFLVSKSKAQK
jgi:hypothetical protein